MVLFCFGFGVGGGVFGGSGLVELGDWVRSVGVDCLGVELCGSGGDVLLGVSGDVGEVLGCVGEFLGGLGCWVRCGVVWGVGEGVEVCGCVWWGRRFWGGDGGVVRCERDCLVVECWVV